MHITRAAPGVAAADEAHKHGIKVTGHLFVNVPAKPPPSASITWSTAARRYRVSPRQAAGRVPGPGRHAQRDGAPRHRRMANAADMIADLVRRNAAITFDALGL